MAASPGRAQSTTHRKIYIIFIVLAGASFLVVQSERRRLALLGRHAMFMTTPKREPAKTNLGAPKPGPLPCAESGHTQKPPRFPQAAYMPLRCACVAVCCAERC